MGSVEAQTYFLERNLSIHRNLSKLSSNPNSGNNKNRGGGVGAKANNDPSPSYLVVNNNNNNDNYRSTSIGSNLSSIDLSRAPSVNSIECSPSSRRPLLAVGVSDRGYYGAAAPASSGNNRSDVVGTIRFQVIAWNVGVLDVVTASVPMTFRVTLFWNDIEHPDNGGGDILYYDEASVSSMVAWKMHGRHKAFPQEMRDLPQKAVDVPPLAILNCSNFEIIGSPDVDMLCESSRLMRWSCMYRATLIQDALRVDQFPHDDHDLCIKLGIVSHRGKGKRWDRRLWKVALATRDDAQNCTRVPHGLIVDQARLPGFSFNKERGLEFRFCPLEHGAFDHNRAEESRDEYLKVSLNVLRDSGYYDYNIVPLLALMNVVAVSVLTFKDSEFFFRALITLNIAFVAMGIRMTTDSHLPSVGYEIRLQRVLNEYFVGLMCLVLEGMIVYVLNVDYDVPSEITRHVDWMMGVLSISHNAFTVWKYYKSKRRAEQRLAMIDVPSDVK